MLNYIWAGLILFALIFALATDVGDLRHHAYANGVPLPATVEYRKLDDVNARDATVDLRISQPEYAQHFNVSENLATSFPVTLTKMDHGYLLRFAKDAPLPPRMAAMRDFSDSKELVANVDTVGAVNDRAVAVQLTFPKIRFVKLRAITTAAIDTAKAAVMLSIDLIGVLTLWLGVMKIAEASGFID